MNIHATPSINNHFFLSDKAITLSQISQIAIIPLGVIKQPNPTSPIHSALITQWTVRHQACKINLQFESMLYSYDRRHYDDESSESSIEEQDKHSKATLGYGKLPPQKQPHSKSSSEPEESSLSEEEESGRRYEKEADRPARKVEVAAIGDSGSEEEDSSESSIDEIQKRIKKFERDLQSKIERNKKQTAISLKPTGSSERPNALKSAGSPPLPKKQQPKSKIAQPIVVKEQRPSFEQAHRIQQQQEQRQQSLKPLPPQITKNQEQPSAPAKEQKQSPKKKSTEKKQAEEKKKRTESKGLQRGDMGHGSTSEGYTKKLHRANEQIEQLSRAMQELRKQNKRLKQQLSSKSKLKKASIEVERLKQISGQANNVKLEKEIQLLKIIEGLQAKLKKSIAKKLNKSRVGSTSAALLHKGLPSSLIN